MRILRTPEQRFSGIRDFPFAAHYANVGSDLRMHYLDEGPRGSDPVLLLHGEPTWSYLYRKMVPPLATAGLRVVVPDLIGFGKSDKPAQMSDYSYARHLTWLGALLDQLKLANITLFCQDWGSLLGLRLAGEQPNRFLRIMVSNGFLPTADRKTPPAFRVWRAFAKYSPWFPIGRIVKAGCVHPLGAEQIAAYDAPFPGDEYKAGARAFPRLVPTSAGDPTVPGNRKAWDALGRFHKPFLCVFGKNDPILGRADRALIGHVPGAEGQPHDRIRGGHFIQEDCGEDLARRLIEWAR